MSEQKRTNVHLAGSGRISGGVYDTVIVAGSGRIEGDVDANLIKAAGM
jgi:cytoskeletal protein CcmA (bactofilin family)